MKKLSYIFFVLLLLISFNTPASALQNSDISSEAAILIDADTGQVLFEKNSNLKYAPASTTKILTALIVLDKCNLQEKVIVGKKPPYADGSKIYLLEGEELTVEQLLYALLLESANDAAEALAEHVAGSVENFSKMMNEYAKNLGCKNSNFINPHGLYDDNHYTTAYDMALIAKHAMQNEIFRTIVATKNYKIPPTNKQTETRYLNNHNKLLWNGGRYYYKYATGIKTGYTIKAKHTFVGSATKDNINLIAVVLKSPTAVYPDITKLFEFGFNSFKKEKILDKLVPVTYLNLDNGKALIPVVPSKDFYYLIKSSETKLPAQNIILNKNIKSVHKNEIVGKVELLLDGNIVDSIDLLATQDYKMNIINTITKPNIQLAKKNYLKFIYPVMALFLIRGFYRKYKRKKGLS
ncbi:D-alanyl-D-alanine carboxypeptidase family protein [Thermobrachium celere]|uniref:serine-type D-Ala-D-Ala carboxypeptidase n=1 Tax=Thermobrachium celere DSM 8682 TaxID=941824 RepID=R7RRW2_9CLOT|nr:D-alanyl-D-alanine carboxypeptidase family protein [Thermobrachium celere]CDF58101.1 D-alanyl-D-alanine carboxypeptidase [Thermobrachium celere DSM 8682]